MSENREAKAADPKVRLSVHIDAETIARRVAELGAQITRDYPAGTQLCVVGILKGCFVFLSDLVRHIDMPVSCQFLGISSYGSATQSSGVVQITSDMTESIENRDVLIVEDIIDTGLTMRYLLDNLATRRPKSIRVCTFLEKPDNATMKIAIDYVGFRIPNAFVVGYGLDLAGYYRNLPYIGVIHE